MAKKRSADTKQPVTADSAADVEQLKRALRAFSLRGRAAAEVASLNEQEQAAFAKLVTKELDPAGEDFGEKFDTLWTAQQRRLFPPAE